MSKELEALKNIKSEAGIPYFSSLYDIDMWKEDFDIVEKALEQAQKQEKLLELYRYLNENTNDYDLNVDEVDEIHDQIYEIEEKLNGILNHC